MKAVLEGLLFVVGDEGITLKKISEILEIAEEEAKEILLELKKDYESNDRGIRISFLGNSFKLTTKSEHKEYYNKLVTGENNFVLSNAALETLAVVAYNEPITKAEIEEIRGVNSDHIVRKLVARNFLKEAGKADTIGKPTLFKITNEFLDYFGLATKEDLPKLNTEIEEDDSEKELYKSNYKENNI